MVRIIVSKVQLAIVDAAEMTADKVTIRPYDVRDYEDVCTIFRDGMNECVVPMRRQLFTLSNPIQRPIQLACLVLGYLITDSLAYGTLCLGVYCLLAVGSHYLAQFEYLR